MPVTLVRPRVLYAWRGPSLLIVDTRGDCSETDPLSGYYFREARFLRTLRLRIDGGARRGRRRVVPICRSGCRKR